MAACKIGSLYCVQLLLKHGARADIADASGNTAAQLAQQNGHSACAQALAGVSRKK